MANGFALIKFYEENGMVFYKGTGVYFLAKKGVDKTQVSLTESFEMLGTYVFCHIEEEQETTFLKNLILFLWHRNPQMAFVWIENPQNSYWNWISRQITCTLKTKEKWILGQYAELEFEPYRLALSGKMQVTCTESYFLFETEEKKESSFLFRLSKLNGVPVENKLALQMNTVLAGCFTFEIQTQTDSENEIFERMDACIKYGLRLSNQAKRPWRQGNIEVLSCPFLQSKNAINLKVQLDFASISDISRTFLSLPVQLYESALLTVYGHKLSVQAGEEARLVFEKVPRYIYKNSSKNAIDANSRFYLSFAGDFYLEQVQSHLLCGLYGTEFMDMTKAETNQLTMVPNQPGFFEQDTFHSLITTSWIQFPKNSGYFSQTETAPIFFSTEDQTLQMLEVPTLYLTENAAPFPMAFYKDSRSHSSQTEEIETLEQNIYAERHRLLTSNIPEQEKHIFSDEEMVKAVTPQGLMAGVEKSTGRFQWLGIAQTQEADLLPDLRYEEISETFRTQFLSSRLFLLKQDKESFLKEAKPYGSFQILVENWCFLLSTKDWRSGFQEKDTALIMKYTKGQSILELCTNSEILNASIQEAYDEKNKVLPQFQSFLDVVSDPDFQGIVFLNVAVSVHELPKEVSFLLTEVSQENFYAHHVILEGNKVAQNQEGHLFMEKSSIQAVIHYQNENQIVYDDSMPDYMFTTVKIQLAIHNSSIRSFSSESEIFLHRVYGAVCEKTETTSGDCMILDGISQKNEAEVEYKFSLREPGIFQLKGSGIDIFQVEEAGLSINEETGQDGQVHFHGYLQFSQMQECDLLSFEKLPYSNLQLILKNQSEPYLEYANQILSPLDGYMREQSFGSRFACELEDIVYQDTSSPETLGFQSITSPVTQGKLTLPWTGQIWNIPLGSLGNLSNSGAITMKLLVAFHIEKEMPVYYVGIKMPALANGFQVQGILKLGFQSVEFLMSEKENQKYYTFHLHNYTLQVLSASFPSGSNDLFIFSDKNKLGWYAAYKGEETEWQK